MGDGEESPVRRSCRPNFADEVYAATAGGEAPRPEPKLCDSALAVRRAAVLKKLSELREHEPTPQKNEKEDSDLMDIDFKYSDCESFGAELAELYAYAEMNDFASNAFCYRNFAEDKQVCTPFNSLSRPEQKRLFCDLFARLECADPAIRLHTSRTILYLLQGAYLDFADDEDCEYEGKGTEQVNKGTGRYEKDCLMAAVRYAYLAFECGGFPALCSLLMVELAVLFNVREEDSGRDSKASSLSNSRSASNIDLAENERRCRRTATLADNESLRVALSSLYHMVEAIRRPELIEMISSSNERKSHLMQTRKEFLTELDEPMEKGRSLLLVLLDMTIPFYNGDAPHYPMRKVLLLIWKILLALLGGWDYLRETKARLRQEKGLPPVEDTLQVASTLRASIIRENEGPTRTNRKAVNRMLGRQMACTSDEGGDDGAPEDETISDEDPVTRTDESGERTPTAGSPSPARKRSVLPWKCKTRKEDIDMFIQNERQKCFHYDLPGDTDTLFGLPPSILTSIAVLRKHQYTSLNDLQVAEEADLNRYILSKKETVELTRTECVYRAMLPNLSQYTVALLKVLLAAVPSNKAKNDALNILCDVLTPDTECSDVLSNSISLDNCSNSPLEDTVRLTIDINRHKEVMVKASSAILILLLKHFRLNHVYHFEFLSQHIALGNGIPLILKFFDQNMLRYVQSRHELYAYNYPQVALYYVRNQDEWPVLNMDNVEPEWAADSHRYCQWRNLFSSINLVRILNKITKWKHYRTMLLNVYKSAPILKRSLKIQVGVFQVYVLKLMKMQSRYLGRQWRRCNMDVISSIFSKVRHRLSDDWAYANETRAKSWEFRNVEEDLKNVVERFNSRRYGKMYPLFALESEKTSSDDFLSVNASDFSTVDSSFQSVLGVKYELGAKFKQNYEKWMEEEVIASKVDWDRVLVNSKGMCA